MADETRVTYKAVANFLSLKRAAAAAKKDLESLRKEEAKTNKASVEGSKKAAAAHRDATKSLRSRTTSTRTATKVLLEYNKVLQENIKLHRSSGTAAQTAAAKVKTASSVTKDAAADIKSMNAEHDKTVAVTDKVVEGTNRLNKTIKDAASNSKKVAAGVQKWRKRMAELNAESKKTPGVFQRINNGTNNVLNGFKKLGNWRPRLTPPFIALIPLIAGVLALVNPLVAALGALGAAGFAAGSSLLSIGGALIAIVPLISAATASIAGLLVAFKGVGGVFSKWKSLSDARSAGGGGGGGTSAADAAWNLMKAQERLTDAQERAARAQDDLNDARQTALRRLEDLRKAVQRASTDEADAAANLQLATEHYYNIMADPGSTAGDKADALVRLKEAQQEVIDQQDEARRNAEDLAEAEAKGVEGSDEVVNAQRALRDAMREQRDAAHDLEKALNGSGGGGGGVAQAEDEFRKALEKLSPSAQAVVLAIIGMADAWNKVQQTVQESFFSEIVDDMDDLASLLPSIENLLSKAAGALGRFVSSFIRMVSSPAWKSDLVVISETNVGLIDQAGRAVLALSTAFKDLIIAAGPFAEDLLRSFANLSESFSGIVANARETGSLAKWLDTVYGRLQQWWRIIKNIAATLFNYGAASADFGQWITDGLEKMTDNWLKSSEAARSQDSPFRAWLEDIKPLLGEVKGLFGDFFGWLRKTSQDNNVITEAQTVLESIRTKLGPALGDLMQTLTESGVGSDFVDTLSSIVESIDEIVKAGGSDGIKAFFDVVTGFFSTLADILDDPVWGGPIKELGKFLGTLAAISFIGKFTGLFSLFSWISKLAQSKKVLTFLSSLAGLKNLSGVQTGGTAGSVASGGAAAGAGGAVATVGALAAVAYTLARQLMDGADTLSSTVPKYLSGDLEQVQDANKEMKDFDRSLFVDSIGGSILGIIDGIFGTSLRTEFQSFFTDLDEGFQQGIQDIITDWTSGFETISEWWQSGADTITTSWTTASDNVSQWWQSGADTVVGWWQSGADTIAKWWNGLVANVSTWWNGLVTNVSTWWNGVVTNVSTWWNGLVTNVSTWWNSAVSTVSTAWSTAIGTIKTWFYNNLIVPVANLFGAKLKEIGPGKTAPRPKGGAIGGLVPQYLAAGGKVRTLGDSRYNMDPRGTDTVPAMLTPGEYVLKKSRVDEYGSDNIQAFNDGLLSLADLLQMKKNSEAPSGVGYFNGGGLARDVMSAVRPSFSSASTQAMTQVMSDNSMHIGNIHIYNPKSERASESLPSALRKVAYQGRGRRTPTPRLDTVDA